MKLTFTIALLLFFAATSGQSKNSFYALDAKMNETTLDSSKYILWIHERDDKNWQWDYYRTWGPMIKSNSYEDHDGTKKNGPFYLYTVAGILDSMGNYDHGRKKGDYYKYIVNNKDSGISCIRYHYEADTLTGKQEFLKSLEIHTGTDSASTPAGDAPTADSGWDAFLSKSLIYPERAAAKKIEGTVGLSFEITAEGEAKDAFINKSVEYSLDQEALKLITHSGKWRALTANGVNTKSIKTVHVSFRAPH